MLAGLGNGSLTPLISRTFAFDEVQEATRFLESNEQVGKIVLTV
nr:zinc-binding dehydrogenase [Novosphingobium panipatense]